MRVSLIIASGKKASLSVKIKPGISLIGRAKSCQVRPKTDSVSKRHCAIVCSEDDVWVEDLGSRTGTLLNREPISGRVRLKNGDFIRTGKVKYRFVIKEEAPSWAAPPPVEIVEAVGAGVSGSSSSDVGLLGDDSETESVPSVSPEPFDEMDLGTLLMELDESDRKDRIERIKKQDRVKEAQVQEQMMRETWFDEDDTPAMDTDGDSENSAKEQASKQANPGNTTKAAAKGLKQIVTGIVEQPEPTIVPIPDEIKKKVEESQTDEDAEKKKAQSLKEAQKEAQQKAKRRAKAEKKKRKKERPSVASKLNTSFGVGGKEIMGLVFVVVGLSFAGYMIYYNLIYDPAIEHAMFKG